MRPVIRTLRPEEHAQAELLYRQAFSAFLKVPDKSLGEANFTGSKLRGQPDGAVGAELNGELVAACFVQRWGSVAVLGPAMVRPTGWTGGAGMLTARRCMEIAFGTWGCDRGVSFTFSQSTQHLEFMRRLELWPRMLNATYRRTLPRGPRPPAQRLSRLDPESRAQAIAATGVLSALLHPGLSLEVEIRKVLDLGIGEVVLLQGSGGVHGFAVCHHGPGSEADRDTCHLKFGMVRPGPHAAILHRGLIDAVESHAAEQGLGRVTLGVNMVHRAAARALAARGYAATIWGIALHYQNAPVYKLPGDHLFVHDDWR
jgi:hypothetical protein